MPSYLVQQFSQLLSPLHVPESRCVGRGHVDHKVVCKLSQLPDPLDIVLSCIHTVLVLPKIHTQTPSAFSLDLLPEFQPLPHSLMTMTVEAIPCAAVYVRNGFFIAIVDTLTYIFVSLTSGCTTVSHTVEGGA